MGGVLAPSQADLPPRDIIMMMRGERLESRGFFSKQRGVTRSQPGLITPRHARRTTGVTGVFLDAEHAPKEFCLSLAAVQPTSLSHAASTQLLLRPIGGWNSSTESLSLSKIKPYDGVRRLTSCYELKSYDGIRRQTSCYEYSPPGFPLAAGTAPQIGKPVSH